MSSVFAQDRPAGNPPGSQEESPDLDPGESFGEAASEIAADPELILDKVDVWVEGFYSLLPNLVAATVLFVFFLLLAVGARSAFWHWAHRRRRDNLGEVLGGLIKWAIILVGALLSLTVILPSLRPGDLLAGLGVGSVAIGFAFKDILQNWLAGLLILINRPFRIGDQIVVNGHEGAVERIETRATDIRTYDGRKVLIPNSDVYTNAVVVNTAYETLRSEYEFGIGYGDNIGLAAEVITNAISTVDGVRSDPAPQVFPWDLAASAVTLKAWWWTDSRRAEIVHVRGRVIEAIKVACDDHGIDLPFETVVQLWHDQTEEWDGIRGRQREGWPKPGGNGEPPRPARSAPAPGQGEGEVRREQARKAD